MPERTLGVLIDFKQGGFAIVKGSDGELFWTDLGRYVKDPNVRLNDVIAFHVIEAKPNTDALPVACHAKVIARGVRQGFTYGEWLSWLAENSAAEPPKQAAEEVNAHVD